MWFVSKDATRGRMSEGSEDGVLEGSEDGVLEGSEDGVLEGSEGGDATRGMMSERLGFLWGLILYTIILSDHSYPRYQILIPRILIPSYPGY